MKRTALIVAATVAAISLFLLATATANTDMFADSYPYLLAINGFIAVALAGLVTGFSDDGRLLLREADGSERAILAGRVRLPKPAAD